MHRYAETHIHNHWNTSHKPHKPEAIIYTQKSCKVKTKQNPDLTCVLAIILSVLFFERTLTNTQINSVNRMNLLAVEGWGGDGRRQTGSWKEIASRGRTLEAAVTSALACSELISNSPYLCLKWMTMQPLASKLKALSWRQINDPHHIDNLIYWHRYIYLHSRYKLVWDIHKSVLLSKKEQKTFWQIQEPLYVGRLARNYTQTLEMVKMIYPY